MKLSDFKFNLPSERIAMYPPESRDESRLMIVDRATGTIEHKYFSEILKYYGEGDVMVINNTKVFPARLYGKKEKTGARIEVFLLRELNAEAKLWDVLVDPARKIRVGNKLYFGNSDDLVAEVIDNTTSRGRTIRFLFDGENEDFKNILKEMGEAPIHTKVIQREVEPEDKDRYQTLFAKQEGAVAAPTAGMHYSRELIKRLQIQGVEFADITLHAGLGNFRNIEVEDLTKHKIESEEIIIAQDSCDIVNHAKREGKNICAVGTTTMRTLESSVTLSGEIRPYMGWTNLFIFPPYKFRVANSMVSNFHLPQSSLMIMVSAFAGYDLLMKAYKVAVEEKYNFFTFGDAMLIL
jgi:S-adenosylmethionine:tRNA ribosyltransferase-isomerase